MPIEHKDEKTTIVSCQGDIVVLPFFPENCDGVAWLLMHEGPQGEPGRDITPEDGLLDPRYLQEQHGVLIGATDYRSLDTIIGVLTALRDHLRDGPPVVMGAEVEQDIAEGIAESMAKDIDREILDDMAKATCDGIDSDLVENGIEIVDDEKDGGSDEL